MRLAVLDQAAPDHDGAVLLLVHRLRMLGHADDLGGDLRAAGEAGMLRGERLDHVGGTAQDDGKTLVGGKRRCHALENELEKVSPPMASTAMVTLSDISADTSFSSRRCASHMASQLNVRACANGAAERLPLQLHAMTALPVSMTSRSLEAAVRTREVLPHCGTRNGKGRSCRWCYDV